LSAVFFLSACGTMHQAYYSDAALNWEEKKHTSTNKKIHTLYLIGDSGELDDTMQNKNFVLEAVANSIQEETVETSLAYLGDNIYPGGMPKEDNAYRNMAERILDEQLHLATLHNGHTYFIPGNHDWNKHKPGGRKAILRQENYVKEHGVKGRTHFFPKHACGDPEVVKINKDLVYVFLDSQWWLQEWSKEKKMNRKCDIKTRGDLLKRMEEIFVEHKNDDIIVMLHHPIKSNGKHGGNFSLKEHIFPLTELNHNLWVPLPLIGSLYPVFRNVTGSNQDVTNIDNQLLMQGLNRIAKERSVNVIFASGHEHGMQFFDGQKIKFIVSGGGSRTNYIRSGDQATYVREARGYAKIDFYENNESWLEIYNTPGFGIPAKLEFRTQLRAARAGTEEDKIKYPPVKSGEIEFAANKEFKANVFKKIFLGSLYREMWTTPVKAELIDLEMVHGGLIPIKKGGGNSSNSLRTETENGKQYILRSIVKDYTKLVPPQFKNLKVLDVLADLNSASHPYGALIIPELSRAVGVYYTDPKLVYLKHQTALGNYNSQFPEELYLLEERPSGNWSDAEQFGNSADIISYSDVIDVLQTKKNHFIDQEWVLKSRMFDLLIHDWDRHDDQWRWAKIEKDGKNIYRPIPRDRDQAFYKVNGIIPWYVSHALVKQLHSMNADPKKVKYLGFNAKHFDRYFLHELEWSEWENVIRKMQKDLTDEDISNAVDKFPEEIKHLSDVQELGDFLKLKRKNLMAMGKELYAFLSEEVEIIGTDNKDHFEVNQNSDGSIHIQWFVTRKEQSLLKYDRTFYPSETNIIRLYGLRGKDSFSITGAKNSKIELCIIGGEDKDILTNSTNGREVKLYDNIGGMRTEGIVEDNSSEDVTVNEYDRYGFKYNTQLTGYTFGNTVDDGLWLGAHRNWTNHAWRNKPYQSQHNLSFTVAPISRNAFSVHYDNHIPKFLGKFDVASNLDILFPYFENYFGLGADTQNPLVDRQYHWVRMRHIDINPQLRLNMGKSIHFEFGPSYIHRKVELSENRISSDDISTFNEDALVNRNFIGLYANYDLGFIDNTVFPTNGFEFKAGAAQYREFSKDENLTQLHLESTFWIQLMVRPQLVLANKFAFTKALNAEQFYQYPSVGNNNGLRGYRKERFRGNSIFYNNLDIRLKLLKWKNSYLPMDIGILGGFDFSRINYDELLGSPWKSSRTVGLWFDLLGVFVIQPSYSFNKEQNTFNLNTGFAF